MCRWRPDVFAFRSAMPYRLGRLAMNQIAAWTKASRLPSQSYIFLPLLLGQALSSCAGGTLDWGIFVLVQLFGLFDQLYIVYANDFADVQTDRLNRTYTPFSGGSRVLVDGDLTRRQLGVAAWAMALLSIACGVALGLVWGRWLVLPLILVGLALLWAYSYPPLRLSYRGGGEVLQMLGVGIVLPLIGFAAQSGQVATFPWFLLIAILPTQLACAMGTALPDESSDRHSEKRTAPVLLGPTPARLMVVAAHLASVAALLLLPWPPVQRGVIYGLLAIPVLSGIGQLFFLHVPAGSKALTLSVGLSVLTTLALMGIMSYAAFMG